MNRKMLSYVLAVGLFFALVPLSAKKMSVPGLYHYTLDNGLNLFIMENNAAPLAFVMVTVRAGAVTQSPENVGLFHLYEHMMFKGNAKYPNQPATIAALNEMGISDWNGFTAVDAVSYYFTVPAGMVRNGLEFWSYAIRTPLMEEKELANEKEVVVSEITANMTNPGRIMYAALGKHLFPEKPWRLDTSGTVEIVRGATAEQLRNIQGEYYVPNNAAVFVGGDVQHDEIYRMVKEIYGDWKKTKEIPFDSVPTKTPFASIQKFVYPDARSSDNFVQTGYYLRGPDAETDAADTYGADMWGYLVKKPDGAYKSLLLSDEALSIPDADYISGYYSTERASGRIALSSVMLNDGSPVKKTERWLEVVQTKGIPLMKTESFLGEKLIADAKTMMENADYYAVETAEGFLTNLSSVWASSGLDYFLGYEKKMNSVTGKQVRAFVEKYIEGKNGMFIVFVSPSVYEKNKAEFSAAGYAEINADNAFWWKEN
ncbi:MAG: insulinase family protein [Treponema sp.]|nr:insulinase family protein [Treponema sp.]